MTKLAFFDIDGTLATPYFMVDGTLKTGFTLEDWYKYSAKMKDKIYDNCKPVKGVYEYAKKLKESGARLFVLSAIGTSYEAKSKDRFTEKHFPGLFEENIYVGAEDAKIPIIEQIAQENNVKLEECEIIEDRYFTCIAADLKGINAIHISEFLN